MPPGYGHGRGTSPGLYKIKSQQPQVLCDMIAGGRGWGKKVLNMNFFTILIDVEMNEGLF